MKKYELDMTVFRQPCITVNGLVMGNDHILFELQRLQAALVYAHRVIAVEIAKGRTPELIPVANGGKGFGFIEDAL